MGRVGRTLARMTGTCVPAYESLRTGSCQLMVQQTRRLCLLWCHLTWRSMHPGKTSKCDPSTAKVISGAEHTLTCRPRRVEPRPKTLIQTPRSRRVSTSAFFTRSGAAVGPAAKYIRSFRDSRTCHDHKRLAKLPSGRAATQSAGMSPRPIGLIMRHRVVRRSKCMTWRIVHMQHNHAGSVCPCRIACLAQKTRGETQQ